MKFSILSVLACLLVFSACKKDKDDDPIDPEYSITIMQPDATTKMMGDTMHIHVNFDSGNQMTIHNVQIQIDNITHSFFVLDKPQLSNVNDTDGHWEFHYDLPLTGQWNVLPGSTMRLEAKVWGEEPGDFEVSKTLDFQIAP